VSDRLRQSIVALVFLVVSRTAVQERFTVLLWGRSWFMRRQGSYSARVKVVAVRVGIVA